METRGTVEKNFFFIDANNLDTIRTRLYGYCIANDINGNEMSLEDAEFSGEYSNGAYTLVQSIDDKIYISQDYNGACGIYLFRQGDYFALSNSFLLLVEKLEECYSLSLNYDYANAYIVSGLSPLAYSETLVNEIEILPRNVKVIITREPKEIEIVDIDYQEHSVEISTVKGLQILDQWYEKWTCMIREIKAKTNNIVCDLSGGFDSRLTFGLVAHAGIDLDEIRVKSIKDKLHTHEEDYAIASRIAAYFSTSLNCGNLSQERINVGMEECINISFYAKLDVHKQMYWRMQYVPEPLYCISGAGGEFLRALWYEKPELYMEKECKRGRRYKNVEASEAVKKIISNAYEKTRAKFPFADEKDPELTQLMYRETRCRHHFGKDGVEFYCVNGIKISPLMDANLGKLCNHHVEDANLLIAVIFTRYYPELLDFPFEGGRKIKKETIEYAKKINQMLPFSEKRAKSEKRMIYGGDNQICYKQKENLSNVDVLKFVYDVFKSDTVHNMIAEYFHEDIYEFADNYAKTHKYFPLQEIYPLIGIYIVQNAIINSGKKSNQSVFEQMKDAVRGG